MSPLAKVFVVVNLILSVAFFGSSATLFSTRVNWRERFETLKKETDVKLKDSEDRWKVTGKKIVDIDQDRTKLTTNFNSLSSEKAKLQGELNEAKTKISQLGVQNESLVKDHSQLNATLQDLVKKRDDLTALLDAARKEADDAKDVRGKALEDMTRFRLDLDKVNEELSKARIEYKDLKDKAETMALQLDYAGKMGLDLSKIASAPPIDAIVQAVKAEDKLVVLSVGRDQKVQEGFEFTIYRGDKFVGKVRVVKVWEDLAGAQILYTSDDEAVQVGDKAATQI